MKKILSVLLAMMMVLTMLVGCQTQPVQNDDEQARQVVENYLEALTSFKFKEAASYTNDPDALMADAPYESTQDAMDKIIETLPEEFQAYKTDVIAFGEALFENLQEKMSYQILNVEKDGETYLASIEITSIDFDNFDSTTLMNNMMQNINVEELLTELLENGSITETMSEEEMMDVLFPALFQKMAEAAIELPVETTTEKEEFSVIQMDGTWVLDVSSLQ